MDSLRALLGEIHRRSLWQVLGIYLATSWGVLNAVDVLTGFAGLPDWTPTMALVLLLIGLPIVMATAVLQQGFPGQVPSDDVEPDAPPADEAGTGALGTAIFTWRNAIGGGALAGVLLIVATGVYLFMWSTGIGSVGSLVAQGVLDAKDPVLLAEFGNQTPDETLGTVVSAALEVDLGSSQTVTLLGRDAVSSALTMMGRDPDEPVTDVVAREVALRMNVKAFITGEVSRVGTRYLLVARIVNPETGDDLVSFREEAAGDDDLLPAIDRLSQRLREKMGESLRTIRLDQPLEQVTTSSLDALRKLTQAEEIEGSGDYDTALRLLNEAVALDTAFAMAYRKISVLRFNTGAPQESIEEASELAFRHRDRLTERERYLTEANYYMTVTGDRDAAIRAYESVLTANPDDGSALNNVSNLYRSRGDLDTALARLDRAVSGGGASSVAYSNRAIVLSALGDLELAEEAYDSYVQRYPGHIYTGFVNLLLAAARGDHVELLAASERAAVDPDVPFLHDLAPLYGLSAHAFDGRVAAGLDQAREIRQIGVTFGQWDGTVHIATGESAIRLWLLDDPVAAAVAMRRDLEDRFDPLSDGWTWASPIIALAEAGEVETARTLLDGWESEGATAQRTRGRRLLARAAIEHAEGDPPSAHASIEEAVEVLKCSRCGERQLALILEDLGRTAEAIEIWERRRALPLPAGTQGWDRIIALKHLGPLYEEVEDSARAIEAYQAFAEAWADGDAIVQPQVAHARSRIAALSGAAPA